MAPIQKPGRSEQSVQTPSDFIHAVKKMWGISEFGYDLAADSTNTQAPEYFDEEDNSLQRCWYQLDGWLWLNPPFADIGPWVKKAYEEGERGAKILVLVPASVGSNWWKDWVHEKAHVMFLNGRLTFVGHSSPYPKDLALLMYCPHAPGIIQKRGYAVWDWRHPLLSSKAS